MPRAGCVVRTRRIGTARPSTCRALAGPGRRAVRIDCARQRRLRNAADYLGGTTIAATIGSAGERHPHPVRKDRRRRQQPRARNRRPPGVRGNRGRRCPARERADILGASPAPAAESRPAFLGGHARHVPLRSTPTRARRAAIRRRRAGIDQDLAAHRRPAVRVDHARETCAFACPTVGVEVAVIPVLRTVRRHGARPCICRSRREGRQQERHAPERDRPRRSTLPDNCLRVVHRVGSSVPLAWLPGRPPQDRFSPRPSTRRVVHRWRLRLHPPPTGRAGRRCSPPRRCRLSCPPRRRGCPHRRPQGAPARRPSPSMR